MSGAGQVFYKMTGSGNDFVMLDGRSTSVQRWPSDRIAQVCDRRLGIGADGLVILTPETEDRIRMDYFNSDGSVAPMCGNAALCATRLAALLELARLDGMTLVTGAGLMRTRCAGGEHLAELQMPSFAVPAPVPISAAAGESGFWLGIVGVPHLIVLTDDVHAVDVERRGRELRLHPALGPGGANVNFVSAARSSSDGARGPWLIRTYERGVEAETLACGTGTLAAAFALDRAGIRSLPGDWETCRGIRLAVAGTIEGEHAAENWLCGEGRLVFTGILR